MEGSAWKLKTNNIINSSFHNTQTNYLEQNYLEQRWWSSRKIQIVLIAAKLTKKSKYNKQSRILTTANYMFQP